MRSPILFSLSLSVLLSIVLASWSCRRESAAPPPPPAAPAEAVRTPAQSAPLPSADLGASLPSVVFLGDSLTAGLGVAVDEAFPARVGEILAERGLPVRVVNAGVSGDTSAGGLRRLAWQLRQKPAVVVVELGANDGLRGLPVRELEANLLAIVRQSQAAGAQVVLTGMLVPPNYGAEYAKSFAEVYPRVARTTGVALVPFLLDGVGGEADLNQPDGIHPTAEGHRRVAATVAPWVAKLVGTPVAGR